MTKALQKEHFAVVLAGGEKKTAVLSALKYAGWIEFRVDEFLKNHPEGQLVKWVSSPFSASPPRGECPDEGDKFSLNRIGTVRWKKEHQSKGLDMPEKKRLEIYGVIAGFVDFMDVEIRSGIARDVVKLAGEKGKKVIVSYHDFSETPSCRELDKILREGMRLRPDMVKVATFVRTKSELLSLLAFTCKHSETFPLVVIPMGVPVFERLAPLSFGSRFTYVSLDNETAPGQISCRLLRKMYGLSLTGRKKI